MRLVVREVRKAYGETVALDGVSLTAGPGVVALLGPNGSGKSTLLRILATVTRPDGGALSFAGLPYDGDLRLLRRLLGYQPQHLRLPEHLTPRRFLHYMAQLKGVEAEPQSEQLLNQMGLGAQAERPLGRLSGGMLRRLAIAQALLGAPRLLLLDEPTRGLDPQERERVMAVVSRMALDRVVVLSSHLPGEVAEVAAQLLVLKEGRVAYAGGVAELLRTREVRVWELTVPPTAVADLLDQHMVSRVREGPGGVTLRVVGEPPPGEVVAVPATLEDAYLALVGSAGRPRLSSPR